MNRKGLEKVAQTLNEWRDKIEEALDKKKEDIMYDEVKKEHLKVTSKAIRCSIERKIESVKTLLDNLDADASEGNVKRFMYTKKDIMELLLSSLPLGGRHCPFCEANEDDCTQCSYGKKYGNCNVGEKSVYVRLSNKKYELSRMIEYYFE